MTNSTSKISINGTMLTSDRMPRRPPPKEKPMSHLASQRGEPDKPAPTLTFFPARRLLHLPIQGLQVQLLLTGLAKQALQTLKPGENTNSQPHCNSNAY